MKVDDFDMFPLRVRDLQARYQKAHEALLCWGNWSRDRRGLYPADSRPSIWDQFKRDENEAWGDEDAEKLVAEAPAKAERAEEEPYDELQGTIMDERLHLPGGPCLIVRQALVVAYVRRDIHESQYPRAAGCIQDQFLERLEGGLMFAGRFA